MHTADMFLINFKNEKIAHVKQAQSHCAKSESVKEKKIKLIVKISEFRIIDDMMMQIKSLDSKS